MTSLLDTRYMTLSGSLESLFSRVDTLEAFGTDASSSLEARISTLESTEKSTS